MLSVPTTVADPEPASAVLPEDLAVCTLGVEVAVEDEARRLLGDLPDRPTASIKFHARLFRLFLTLQQRRERIPRAFVCDALASALGLGVDLRRTKSRMMVAAKAGDARREGRGLCLQSVHGVRERQAFTYLAEPDVGTLAKAVQADADALHHLAHPVADPDRLAGQVITHIREAGYTDEDAKVAVTMMVDAVMLGRGQVSELMVVALAMALGVIGADGEMSPRHLGSLLGTRLPLKYIKAARADGAMKRITGRMEGHLNGKGDHDRTIDGWRRLNPYRQVSRS